MFILQENNYNCALSLTVGCLNDILHVQQCLMPIERQRSVKTSILKVRIKSPVLPPCLTAKLRFSLKISTHFWFGRIIDKLHIYNHQADVIHLTPAGLPSGIPGIGEEIDNAMQQAPQPERHSMIKLEI